MVMHSSLRRLFSDPPSLSLSLFQSIFFPRSLSLCHTEARIWVLSICLIMHTSIPLFQREDYAWKTGGKKAKERKWRHKEERESEEYYMHKSEKHSRLPLSFGLEALTFCRGCFQMNWSSWDCNWWHATLSLTFSETLVATN